jgi:hypothetical protein
MALTTKRQIVDEIRYQVFGGMPNNSTAISENFVLRLLNNRIAEAAVKNSYINSNLEGVLYADDIFTLTYSNITLLTDANSGLKYFELPTQPVGLPNKRAITIFPPKTRGGFMDDLFKPILRSKVTKVRRLPNLKKVFHFTENGNEYFVDNFQIMDSFSNVNLSIVSAGALDLDDNINMPEDMISGVKALIIAECRQMMGIQDLTPLPAVDNPQPRR